MRIFFGFIEGKIRGGCREDEFCRREYSKIHCRNFRVLIVVRNPFLFLIYFPVISNQIYL